MLKITGMIIIIYNFSRNILFIIYNTYTINVKWTVLFNNLPIFFLKKISAHNLPVIIAVLEDL